MTASQGGPIRRLARAAASPADVSSPLATHIVAQRLWLALRLPELPLRALGMRAAGSPPLAMAERVQGRMRVTFMDEAAAAAGVSAGMSVSGACSLCPGLAVRERDHAAEQGVLQGLAAWGCRHTSLVSLQPPDGLLLEVGASLKLFGGLGPLLARIRRELAAMREAAVGEVRLGLAPTPTAAWMLARAACAQASSVRAASVAARLVDHLAPLPLECLQLDLAELSDLHALGLRRVGDCLRLPRQDLARRFPASLLQQLDRARGLAPDPRTPWQPPEVFQRRLDFPWGTRDHAVLLEAARRLLLELCGYLRARAAGARRIEFRIAHAGGRSTALSLELVSLNRDPEHLLALLAERLERLRLPAEAVYLGLRVQDLLPLAPATADLYDPVKADTDLPPAALVERLQARVGRERVHGVMAVADPRPERMSRPCAWGEQGTGAVMADFAAFMPPWLLPSPRPLACREGQPCHGDGVLAVECGPQRIEAGWWDGEDVARDYYVMRSPTGARYWVFRCCRAPHDWHLHGVFA
jgi:protein ImuB